MGLTADRTMGSSQTFSWLDPKVLKLLGHPLRYEVFMRLGERPWSAKQLEPVLGHGWREIREQIRILVKAGLAEYVGSEPGPKGGRLRLYRSERFYFTAKEWAALPERQRTTANVAILRLLFQGAFDSVQSGALESREDHVLIRHPLWTDDQGAKEIEEIMVHAHELVEAVEEQSVSRRAASGEPPVRLVTAFLSFPPADSSGRNLPP
jgi:DNA-binding transcriptional ArsR family regulator